MDNWQRLLDYVKGLPPGKVNDGGTLESLLITCWDDIEGSDVEGTTAEKLVRRIEKLKWNPPVISFVIERHGATVMGSSRAALHKWSVNLETKSAECDPYSSYRQLGPRDKPFRAKDATRAAEDILAAMEEGRDDPRLKWLERPTKVRVILSRSIPDSDSQQTAQGRAKRLRQELVRLAPAYGWRQIDGAVTRFEKSAPCVKPPDTPDQ